MEDLSMVESVPALDKMLFEINFSRYGYDIFNEGSIFILSSLDKLAKAISAITKDLITRDDIYLFIIKNMLDDMYLHTMFINSA